MEDNENRHIFHSDTHDAKNFNEREIALANYRKVIQEQERELDAYRARLKEEQLRREKELENELADRQEFFKEREKKLLERQKEFEKKLASRQEETEMLRHRLHNEIANREAQLEEDRAEIEAEKKRLSLESRRKIEEKSEDYVSNTLETLNTKESQFHFISKIWAGIGASALVIGVIFFIYTTISSIGIVETNPSWQLLIYTLFKGLITVGILVGIAKYSYMFSSSYMQEALKNADRRHAINFGKFYLESYGAAADWAEVKEAFEHWNITGTNAFTKPENSAPLSALEKAVNLIEQAEKVIPKVKK